MAEGAKTEDGVDVSLLHTTKRKTLVVPMQPNQGIRSISGHFGGPRVSIGGRPSETLQWMPGLSGASFNPNTPPERANSIF